MREATHRTLAALAVAASLAAGPAAAQGNLLDQAKGYLGTLGNGGGAASDLSVSEIASGLREALKVGTGRVVERLGGRDGFNADPEVHIPLPQSLGAVQSVLRRVGMAALADDLELRLNRAAETATPKAKALFGDAIAEMTLDDVKKIYDGPEDAATRYFQGKMSEGLTESMTPVVEESLAEVGAIRAYDRMIGEYRSVPFVPDVKADLAAYVVEKGLDGIFLYLAREEAAIRRNPAMRTTGLLQRVFGDG